MLKAKVLKVYGDKELISIPNEKLFLLFEQINFIWENNKIDVRIYESFSSAFFSDTFKGLEDNFTAFAINTSLEDSINKRIRKDIVDFINSN